MTIANTLSKYERRLVKERGSYKVMEEMIESCSNDNNLRNKVECIVEMKETMIKINGYLENQKKIIERMNKNEEQDYNDIRALDDYVANETYDLIEIEDRVKKLEKNYSGKNKTQIEVMRGVLDFWIENSLGKDRYVDELKSSYVPKRKTAEKKEMEKNPAEKTKKPEYAHEAVLEPKPRKMGEREKTYDEDEIRRQLSNIKKYKKKSVKKVNKKESKETKWNENNHRPPKGNYDSDIITLETLTEAISKKIGLESEEARKNANHVLDIFGFEDRTIDNVLDPEDRQVFYLLEAEGMLSTDREEGVLYDGREWRTHYWNIKKGNIKKYANNGKRKEMPMKKTETEEDVYAKLEEEQWSRKNWN